MKRTYIIGLTAIVFAILSGCSYFESGQIQNVGMLVDSPVDGNPWNEKGYSGLLQIEEEYDTNVYMKENVTTEQEIRNTIDEFVQDGVNLIFGHSNIYGNSFEEIAKFYPDVHFVYFNGGSVADNVTSMKFNSHAMGFFGGMIAGEMTSTDQVGTIAAFSWQPEVEGFYEGVKFQNPTANIQINYVNDWNNTDLALEIYETMNQNGVDVIYPVGDSFSGELIRKAEEDGINAIGYITDQLELAPETVLTSTIQHVDKLYELAADQFNKGKLEGEIMTFDFRDEFISLGEFNSDIPEDFQEFINESIEEYMETGLLPNER